MWFKICCSNHALPDLWRWHSAVCSSAATTQHLNKGLPSYRQCGTNHTLAISELGTLWACGVNSKGQLGIGNLEDSYELRSLYGALR